MFNLLQVILAIMAIVAVSGKGQPLIQYVKSAAHPDISDSCYYPIYDWLIPINNDLNPTSEGLCMKAVCREDYSLRIRHCDVPNLGCTSSEYDYEKEFPDCCPQVDCPDETYRTEDDIDLATY